MKNVNEVKKLVKKDVEDYFYDWVFRITSKEMLQFYRKDEPSSTDHIFLEKVEDITEVDCEDIARHINYSNKKHPLYKSNSKRKEIMERRKWINRYKKYGR